LSACLILFVRFLLSSLVRLVLLVCVCSVDFFIYSCSVFV